jgi:Ran GTPase-activating protein (RanGAP) involved in mRNA processing and transport
VTSKITELEIHAGLMEPTCVGLTLFCKLARRPTLTKLGLRRVRLVVTTVELLRMTLCNTPSLQSLVLTNNFLGTAGLAELASVVPQHVHQVLDVSENNLNNIGLLRLLRDILRTTTRP